MSGNCGATATGLPDVAQPLKSAVRDTARAASGVLKLGDDLVTIFLQLVHLGLGPGRLLFGRLTRFGRRVALTLKLVHGLLKLLGLTLLPRPVGSLVALVDRPREEREGDHGPTANRAEKKAEEGHQTLTSSPVWCLRRRMFFRTPDCQMTTPPAPIRRIQKLS